MSVKRKPVKANVSHVRSAANPKSPAKSNRSVKAATRAANKASPSAAPRSTSKLATVVELLRRKSGTTLDEMMKATGWQQHSVRGALSGAIKKRLGLNVTSEKADGVRTYRIAG